MTTNAARNAIRSRRGAPRISRGQRCRLVNSRSYSLRLIADCRRESSMPMCGLAAASSLSVPISRCRSIVLLLRHLLSQKHRLISKHVLVNIADGLTAQL